MSTNAALTQEHLKSVLDYEEDTGFFTWIKAPKSCPFILGKTAGRISNFGYVQIKINGVMHSAHRLAWLYVYGKFPSQNIDHIDGCRTNNAISNLQNVSNRQNQMNQWRHREGRLPGCRPQRGVWEARATFKGVSHHLGRFKTELEAFTAYKSFLEVRGEL
jgi:hypothetical protein